MAEIPESARLPITADDDRCHFSPDTLLPRHADATPAYDDEAPRADTYAIRR